MQLFLYVHRILPSFKSRKVVSHFCSTSTATSLWGDLALFITGPKINKTTATKIFLHYSQWLPRVATQHWTQSDFVVVVAANHLEIDSNLFGGSQKDLKSDCPKFSHSLLFKRVLRNDSLGNALQGPVCRQWWRNWKYCDWEDRQTVRECEGTTTH